MDDESCMLFSYNKFMLYIFQLKCDVSTQASIVGPSHCVKGTQTPASFTAVERPKYRSRCIQTCPVQCKDQPTQCGLLSVSMLQEHDEIYHFHKEAPAEL